MKAASVLAIGACLVPQLVLAGPNANAVLAVHDASLLYTVDTSACCGVGSLPGSCAAIDTMVEASGPDNQRVRKVYAVFPGTASPRLKVMSFGVRYPPDSLMITGHSAGHRFPGEDPSGLRKHRSRRSLSTTLY